MNKDNLSLGDMTTLNGDEIVKTGGGQLLFTGDEIGGYKVMKQLGAGGMGQVYLVENIQMRKQYALKVLPPHLSQNKNFIDRFRVEARVMADLDHPNIVGVMNIGHDTERKLYYLVMQYVSSVNSEKLKENRVNGNQLSDENIPEGDAPAELCSAADFEKLLKDKKKLSEDYVLKITRQLCSALNYAHNFRGKGIVHRDLKPSNILLDGDGNAHIADFGLAKVLGTDYLKSMIDRSMRLTMGGATTSGKNANMSLGDMNTMIEGEGSSQTTDHGSPTSGSGGTTGSAGSLIGTYEYMAPEQQDGQEATVQSDIYSLGLIIYRMLTGRKAKGRFKLPSELGLSKNWDEIIHRSLELESEDRFDSVKEIEELLNFKVNGAKNKKAKSTSSTLSTKNTKKAIVLFLILAVVGIGVWYYINQDKEKTQIENVTKVRLAQLEKEKVSKLILSMDNAFSSGKYPEASKYANQVLSIDSNDISAKNMIQKIISNASYKETATVKVQCEYAVKKVSKLTYADGISTEQQALKNTLEQNLDIGSQFYKDKEYKSAMEYFQKLLAAAGKIKEIESSYTSALAKGKQELVEKNGKEALASFTEAKLYKVTDNVKKLLNEAENMFKFQKYLAEGRKKSESKDWDGAKNEFTLALGVSGYSDSREAQKRMQDARDGADLEKKRKQAVEYKADYINYLNLGEKELKNSDFEKAAQYFKQALAVPTYSNADKALKGLKKAESVLNRVKYDNLCKTAETILAQKKWKEAAEYFKQALNISGYSNSERAVNGVKKANDQITLEKNIKAAKTEFSKISENTEKELEKYKDQNVLYSLSHTSIYEPEKAIKDFISSSAYSYLNDADKTNLKSIQEKLNAIIKSLPDIMTVADAFYYGRNVSKNYRKAYDLYKKAADSGNDEAMIKIGNMSLNGYSGVTKSVSEAVYWYKKASDQGNSKADVVLGNLYFQGKSVNKEQGRAFQYYSKAASKGNSNGMSQLGKMYYYGYGISENKTTAEKWFRKAADAGDRYAERFIQQKF